MKVKVTRNSSSPVEVMGLGLIVPNEWLDVTPEQEAAFEGRNGMTLEESDFETQAVSASMTTKVTRPPVGRIPETPDEDDNDDDEGGEE